MGSGRQDQWHRSGALEANKTPIPTAKNPQAIALLPPDLHLAVPGKFTVAVAAPELSAADGLCR